MSLTKRPDVTVIVPAYNAEATIGQCLAAINAALRPGDRLIVYDDGATDRTNAIALGAGAKVVRNEGAPLGPAHGRNAAAAVATTELLLFVDADVVLSAGAIDLLATEMATVGAAAAFGSYDDRPRSDRVTSLYANLRHHFFHQTGSREASTFWSGIGMIKRNLFVQLGGYNPRLYRHPSIEDVELGVRLIRRGHRIRLVPEALGTHCKDWSLWRVWHTDVVRRAYPWAGLMADGQTGGLDLNTAAGERITALIALAVPVLLIGSLFALPALALAGIAVAAYLFRNRTFFGFLARRLGPARLVAAVVMHWCYHVYASVTFAIALSMTKLRLRKSPDYHLSPLVE